MIGLGASLAFHFGDRHFAGFGKQLRQVALVVRIEVLNQHEGHAGIVRQMAEQLRECLQSAGGGSYADNVRGTACALSSAAGSATVAAEAGLCGCFGGLPERESAAVVNAATPPGRRLPFFFAKRHHCLSRRTNDVVTGRDAAR